MEVKERAARGEGEGQKIEGAILRGQVTLVHEIRVAEAGSIQFQRFTVAANG